MPQPKLDSFDLDLVALAAFAKALSHPARIGALRHLSDGREIASMELVRIMKLSQPACSRHLKTLVEVGLLHARASGSHVFYRLDPSALNSFCQSMAETLHPKQQSS